MLSKRKNVGNFLNFVFSEECKSCYQTSHASEFSTAKNTKVLALKRQFNSDSMTTRKPIKTEQERERETKNMKSKRHKR